MSKKIAFVATAFVILFSIYPATLRSGLVRQTAERHRRGRRSTAGREDVPDWVSIKGLR